MGRQNNDDTLLCSSIALLRERFRRLQQIKEMRKERHILQLTAEAEQPKWFFHHDLKHPSGPLCSSPSLQSEYHLNCAGLQSFEISLSLGLWSNSVSMQASVTSDETEVDTSLHL
ncbi:hypothetical protein MUK42_35661 [Musa troglodytarum]|uniref:Uncharacterized protein n=1 Tax=Musa troglodytarum TaxID=320322 RepID=A0A9E7K965_9LILI|nr:hypothetical protein MUK42_04321 [Musa troglodytarum]URE13119.1 hypothetical protein MUK42_35661 [Musa troglodytarum]